jgi:23S rRNA pseudouridine1911/1915/1917 synthase
MADLIQQQFSQRKPERQYDALVVGHVVQQEGEFRSYLATGKNLTRFSTDDEDDGELAITLYQVVKNYPRTSASPPITHVAVRLETGRRNQIRVHFAEAGYTVLGDARYRPHLWKDIPWPHKRLALHASTLAFVHPTSCEMMRFSSPLPAEFTSFLRYIQNPAREKQRRGSE